MKTINVSESMILELASELAHERAMDILFAEMKIQKQEDAYCEDESGTIIYTDVMQEEFNCAYDYYLTFIQSYLK